MSSNPAIGAITTSPVVFNTNEAYQLTEFDPSTAGSTTISIDTPVGFSTPSNYQQLTATVTP